MDETKAEYTPGNDHDRAVAVSVLRDMADRVDRGPTFPSPPSVIAALIRERAEDIEADRTLP